ncbi:MAG: hypothetical protein ACIARR_03035 [Phycisphaerales bacterium JB059]
MFKPHPLPATLALLAALPTLAHADLIGVNYSTGDVFSISTTDASATRIGQTATGLMGLDRDAAGDLFAITDGLSGSLARLDTSTWALDPVGSLSAGFTFEGGMAISPSGAFYGASRLAGGGRAIFQIDPLTGQMTESLTLSRSTIDLNALQFRDDGQLVAIDAIANEFVSIDTGTGEVSSIASLLTPSAGAVGGLAIENGFGYYVTAGTTSGADGDNSLYRIDLFTGKQSLVGSLGAEAGAGFGIGALAGPAVPAPSGVLALLSAGAIGGVRRRPRA